MSHRLLGGRMAPLDRRLSLRSAVAVLGTHRYAGGAPGRFVPRCGPPLAARPFAPYRARPAAAGLWRCPPTARGSRRPPARPSVRLACPCSASRALFASAPPAAGSALRARPTRCGLGSARLRPRSVASRRPRPCASPRGSPPPLVSPRSAPLGGRAVRRGGCAPLRAAVWRCAPPSGVPRAAARGGAAFWRLSLLLSAALNPYVE